MFTINDFIVTLSNRLLDELPGKKAQLLMTSSSRMMNSSFFKRISRKSSVMILLYPDNEVIKTVFIQRPKYAGVHSGQISLPGGKHEKSDKDNAETALRETFEEVGVEQSKIKIIGRLTELYIPPSNYIVYPFVGFSDIKPIFKASKTEVAKIIEVNIFDFLDENNVILNGEMEIKFGLKIKIPYYYIDGNIIWGATAMIISEFVEVVRSINKRF
jgi:8-oxo-dGTP pyrophosphatase MutT (NUDIX family)